MTKSQNSGTHPENQTKIRETVPGVQAPFNEIWFESGGTRLFAVEAGGGRPIVFVHGGLADHRAVTFRVGPLASTHRLVAPDLRGSGRSLYAETLSWDMFADDLVALLDHLGMERAVVGGTSMGSAVAIRFALRHPSRVGGLILMSPLYPGADRELPAAASEAMRAMAEAGERAVTQGVGALRQLFEGLPPPMREVALQMMLGFDAASVGATTRFLASNVQPMDSASDLEAIDTRVMILPGTDPQHPAEIAELYARNMREPVVVEQTSSDYLQRVNEFCDSLLIFER